MAILKIRDENGNVYEVLALRGEKGDRGVDAYEKAVEYGYEGTEAEFYRAMGQNGTPPSTDYTVEVKVVPWSTDDGYYFYQDIEVPGIKAEDNPIPGVAYVEDNNLNVVYDECFGRVLHITTFDNKVRVWINGSSIPSAFPLILKKVVR